MLESQYQSKLIRKLKRRFPGCVVLKNDTDYMQGIPDLSIFYGDRWAMLEVKSSATAPEQPNQDYYVHMLNELSFASFIWPEVENEVLDALQRALRPTRSTRIPQRQ